MKNFSAGAAALLALLGSACSDPTSTSTAGTRRACASAHRIRPHENRRRTYRSLGSGNGRDRAEGLEDRETRRRIRLGRRPHLGKVGRLPAVHRRARQQNVEVVGRGRPGEIPRSLWRRRTGSGRMAGSGRQRHGDVRCQDHPVRGHGQSRDPDARSHDEDEDGGGDELRRQEVLEPERRDTHEERRDVLHRSAVRLQEVR